MRFKVKVDGVDDVVKAIEDVKRSVLEELEDAADEGALAIAAIVRGKAPGTLSEGVATKRLPRKTGKPAVSMVGILWFGYQHAHLVEFGTAGRQHKNGKSVGAMPANPFFRSSMDESRGIVKGAFIGGVSKAIKKAGKQK
jgi:HK97 gp10 family phage protein